MPPRVYEASNRFAGATDVLGRIARDWSGADHEAVKAGANALARSLRKVLNVRGNGIPSQPGSPPRRQAGRLAKAPRAGLRDGERVVAITWFTGIFHEDGVNAELSTRKRARRRQRAPAATPRVAAARRPRGAKVGRLVLPKRPFMDRGRQLAETEMAAIAATAGYVATERVVLGIGQ